MLLREVTPRTRLFALSHVCWMSGNRFPVEELKAATGLPVLVDGAQSAGALAVDATAFDFYAFSCQKWLCGPDATGGLVVRDPEALPVAAPSYLSQAGLRADRRVHAARRRRALRLELDAGAVAGRPLRGARPRAGRALRARAARWPRAAASCSPSVRGRDRARQGDARHFPVDGDSAELVRALYERA